MSEVIKLAKEVQGFAAKQLYVESVPEWADIEEWNAAQLQLAQALAVLKPMSGSTPEEEGELALAVLMGNCVVVRNVQDVQQALERAQRVMPDLTDKVLRCKLAVYCYVERPDEELAEQIRTWLAELKSEGREAEIIQAEKQFLLS